MSGSRIIPEPLGNDSRISPFPFRTSRARADQGAGSMEQGSGFVEVDSKSKPCATHRLSSADFGFGSRR